MKPLAPIGRHQLLEGFFFAGTEVADVCTLGRWCQALFHKKRLRNFHKPADSPALKKLDERAMRAMNSAPLHKLCQQGPPPAASAVLSFASCQEQTLRASLIKFCRELSGRGGGGTLDKRAEADIQQKEPDKPPPPS